jgi:hypothetical protein
VPILGKVARHAVIEYRGVHAFELSPAELWEAIEQVERFEDWWGWLRELSVCGAGPSPASGAARGGALRSGTVLSGVVAPPLPYRMRVQVHLTRCVRPRRIEADVHGDLEGEALLVVHRAPNGCSVDVAWSIEMMQAPMRLADRVAHPLLCWGHDRVVDMTVAGFRRHVSHLASRDEATRPQPPMCS